MTYLKTKFKILFLLGFITFLPGFTQNKVLHSLNNKISNDFSIKINEDDLVQNLEDSSQAQINIYSEDLGKLFKNKSLMQDISVRVFSKNSSGELEQLAFFNQSFKKPLERNLNDILTASILLPDLKSSKTIYIKVYDSQNNLAGDFEELITINNSSEENSQSNPELDLLMQNLKVITERRPGTQTFITKETSGDYAVRIPSSNKPVRQRNIITNTFINDESQIDFSKVIFTNSAGENTANLIWQDSSNSVELSFPGSSTSFNFTSSGIKNLTFSEADLSSPLPPENTLEISDGKLYITKNGQRQLIKGEQGPAGTIGPPGATGSSGTPGGSNTQIQFNNSGAFGGDSNFVWDNSNKRLGVGTASPIEIAHIKSLGAANSELLIDTGGSGVPLVRFARNGVKAWTFYQNSGDWFSIGRFGAGDAFNITSSDSVVIGQGGPTSARLNVNSNSSTTVGQIIRAAAAQTANLQEWQNSVGTALAAITQKGFISSANAMSSAGGFAISSAGGFGYNTYYDPTNTWTNVNPGDAGFFVRFTSGGGEFYSAPAGATPAITARGGFSPTIFYWLERGAFGGTGETGTQLLVNATASTNKGCVVKGAPAQTANLQEWQNSAGTVGLAINASREITSATAGAVTVRLASSGGQFRVIRSSGSTPLFTDDNPGTGITVEGGIGLYGTGPYTIRGVSGSVLNLGSSAGTSTDNISNLWMRSTASVNWNGDTGLTRNAAGIVEINTGTAGTSGALRLGSPTAATVAVIIKSAPSQTANLTEWQNSTGTVLALVNESGDIEITDSTRGIILKSPNGTRWRIQVTNAGTLTTTSL